MQKLFYYHFCVVVVTCHWFCNQRILRFHRPGMKAPAEPELPIQKFNFVDLYFSLNSDTRIYICDILLLLGLNANYKWHTYHYNSPHNSYEHFGRLGNGRKFRLFYRLVISLLVLRAGYGIWLYQFLIIAYLFTLLEIKRK